jgi:glutamyl-tRNA synthetase
MTGTIDHDLLRRAMPVLKVRAKDVVEIAQGAAFLFAQRPLALDAKAEALLTPEARALLGRIQGRLPGENGWTSEAWKPVSSPWPKRSGWALASWPSRYGRL